MIARLIYAAVSVGLVASFSTGPPAEVPTCLNLIPGSSSPHWQQAGNGTYDITINNLLPSSGFFAYTAGVQYTGEFER